MDDDQVKKKKNSLLYNVLWMDRVFRTRTAAEELLSPEREAGNITPRDYDASLEFLPNYHRYYPILCCVGATSLALLRPTKWSQAKQGMTAFTLGFTGFTLGKFVFLNAHYDYVRKLENPAGFDRAMENIKSKLGAHVPESFIIERVYEPSSTDNAYGSHIPEHESSIMLPTSSDSSSPQASQTSTQKPQTKWDQIRNANSRAANTSSWDALRQKHEKDAVKSRNSGEEVQWDESS